ncbi:MAG: BMP family ABC transporter substrate-binding protein, partial [Oscillospiraceae bacterium]|nr:BMP family ABC transporter substrate-binding protein [Oscillospiraceae bacterium]
DAPGGPRAGQQPDEDATVTARKNAAPKPKEVAAKAPPPKKKFPLWIPIVGVLAIAAVIALLFITGVLGSGKFYPADWANREQDGITAGWHGTEVLSIRPEGNLIRVEVYDERKVPKSSDGSRWLLYLWGPSDDSGYLYIDNTGYTGYYQYSESEQTYHEIISQSTEISWDGGRTYSFTIHPAVFNGFSWRDISSVVLDYRKANGTFQYGVYADLTSIPAPANEVKAGFIFLHDENTAYDINFMNAAREACDSAGVEYIFKTGVPEAYEAYDAALELIDDGCNFIFADSFGYEEYMIQAAMEYPDVDFCAAGGTRAHTEGLPNYHNAWPAIHEGRYLSGVAAGMKLNEMIEEGVIAPDQAKLGFVGAFRYTECISAYTAFFLGARSVCPGATMEVFFTHSWDNYQAEYDAAKKLVENGCVLISQYSESYGVPAFCETYYDGASSIPNVAYGSSNIEGYPGTYLVSSRINWVPYFNYVIEHVRYGDTMEPDWSGGIGEGAVELTELNETVAAPGTWEAVDAAKAALLDGSLYVFDTNTFTVNGESLTEYMADVDSDAAYMPDTSVIFNGYFHESEFRSSPYFDLDIDGVTLLNSGF